MKLPATLLGIGIAGTALCAAPPETADAILIEADKPVVVVERQQPEYRHEFIFFCFFEGAPTNADITLTNGIKVGAPMSFGAPVNGLEASVFNSASSYVNGIQCSILVNTAKEVEGLQFGIANFLDNCYGLQLGIVNMAQQDSFQIGLVNIIEDGWLPFFPIVNFNF